MSGIGITLKQVNEKARIAKLKPTESDLKGMAGYFERMRPDGKREWGCNFKPNDGHGKLTRDAQVIGEMMTPFNDAATEHQRHLQSAAPREALVDQGGSVHYVDPFQASSTAERNGWRPAWRAGGAIVERGTRDMLFRWIAGGWYPLGVRCLGTPLTGKAALSKKGLYHDPSGGSWRWIDGEWDLL